MTSTQPLRSALYLGSVMHRRLSPRRHRLRYRAFWMLIDLDETGALSERLALFSRNRFNLFSFHDADHGDGGPASLRAYVDRTLSEHNVDCRGGRIALLCMPRILGYVFNPLSIYFCHRADGSLAALLYEVRNTFGEMHSYLLPVSGDAPLVHQHCAKEFYVSPFLGMDMTYDFRVAPPGERISVVVAADDKRGPVLVASLSGERRALTDRALAAIFVSLPLMTLKVMAAIHWEALKIWWKGMRLYPRPPAPRQAVTAGPVPGGGDRR
ncbi:MAG: DUF1365 family protein [Proteobacteria bacterium]|nr:DUF1365 family protein [Pseudomonadota bacterium]